MKVIKINPNNPHPDILTESVKCLSAGGTLVYPTDTCYGLGADMLNPIAVNKIYKIKNRQDRKPLSLIIRNISQLKKYAFVENKQELILKRHLPGQFTFVLLSINYDIFKQSSVGIRMPNYKFTKLLSDKFSNPYCTTSANISGHEPCYDINCILKQFTNAQAQPNLILDAGQLPKNLPSTVVDLTNWPPNIIRQGAEKLII